MEQYQSVWIWPPSQMLSANPLIWPFPLWPLVSSAPQLQLLLLMSWVLWHARPITYALCMAQGLNFTLQRWTTSTGIHPHGSWHPLSMFPSVIVTSCWFICSYTGLFVSHISFLPWSPTLSHSPSVISSFWPHAMVIFTRVMLHLSFESILLTFGQITHVSRWNLLEFFFQHKSGISSCHGMKGSSHKRAGLPKGW